jgi:hypothetical protein
LGFSRSVSTDMVVCAEEVVPSSPATIVLPERTLRTFSAEFVPSTGVEKVRGTGDRTGEDRCREVGGGAAGGKTTEEEAGEAGEMRGEVGMVSLSCIATGMF